MKYEISKRLETIQDNFLNRDRDEDGGDYNENNKSSCFSSKIQPLSSLAQSIQISNYD